MLIAASLLAATTYTAATQVADGSTGTAPTAAQLAAHRAAVRDWRGIAHRRRVTAVSRAQRLGIHYHPGALERRTVRLARLQHLAHRFHRRARQYRAVIRRRFPKLLCIHRYEGSWSAYNPAGPYYGGFQMDAGFMQRWGADKLRKYGGRDARYWSARDQLAVASRVVAHIGFGSWPNTAAMCGLL